MNAVFAGLAIVAVVFAAFSGTMEQVSTSVVSSAELAVSLSIKLIGIMALWLGLMKVAEAAGLVKGLARLVRPVLTRLFPDVPADHPAMAAMVLNLSANAFGLGNAATPLGLKAMDELQKLNPEKDVATDAMALFLVINTSSVQLVPITVIGLRAAAGATQPADIIVPTLIATIVSTGVGITVAKLLARMPRFRDSAPKANAEVAE